jgi:hypothetical protein
MKVLMECLCFNGASLKIIHNGCLWLRLGWKSLMLVHILSILVVNIYVFLKKNI